MVPKAAIVDVLLDRHQLHYVISCLLYAGEHLVSELPVGGDLAVEGTLKMRRRPTMPT